MLRWLRPVSFALAALVCAAGPLASQSLSVERIDEIAAEQADEAFARFHELLSLPNDANYPDDILRLTEWIEGEFEEFGFATRRLEMPGSDAVLATREAAGADRTVLIYLQADGQPVDPDEWHQESPWTPTLKMRRAGATSVDGNPDDWQTLAWERLYDDPDPEWRMFARSASDSKGPIAKFLAALSILETAGVEPDFDMKVIVDTEEEMGSPHLADAIERYSDELAADMLVIFDGPPHESGRPTLKFGARGIATITLTTYGPRVAQHSGHWGNYVPNPVFRMAEVLASVKDDRGRVTIPGFYDGIELDAETRAILEAVPDDIEALHDRMGIAEPDLVGGNPQEAVQYPSFNVRGIRAAWVGNEARTIVPPEAVAEVDVRLVRETDPERLLGLIRGHIESLGFHVISGRDPTDEERASHPKILRFDSDVNYAAFRTDFDSEPGRWLTGALERLLGETPIRVRTSGGSIPISPFVTTLGVPAVSVPTVNPDNNQHSPNENLRVADFQQGIRIIAAILTQPMLETPASLDAPDAPRDVIDRFAEALAADVEADGGGGATAALFRGDRVLWAQGFGLADREREMPAGVRTIYRTGSISKSMTAVLMADLAEDGVLALDDPVVSALPEAAGFGNAPEGMSPITFRQLASHTAGLIREPMLEDAAAGPIDGWRDKILASIPKTGFYGMPGTKYQYSNIAYGTLGLALERAAGRPFMEMMEERIFEPLGMRSSTFVIGRGLADRLAAGYAGEDYDPEFPALEHAGRGYKVPNGGVYSTVGDLATFAAAVMGRTSTELLEPATRAEIMRRQTPEDGPGYGLGFSLRDVELPSGRTVRFVGHGGSVAGYNAYLVFEPESGYGVAIMRNYNAGRTGLGEAASRFLREVLAAPGS